MKTKDKVIQILEENRDQYISGQRLAEELEISRSGIWKIIKGLKDEGYAIESKTNLGYKLLEKNDILSLAGIRSYLAQDDRELEIVVLETVDSTNNYAKQYALGKKGQMLIVANEQTAGRGRRGRSFSSPENGLYLSLVLRPEISLEEVYFSTIMTVVALHRVLSRLTEEEIGIKWVNDLYIGERKISGILTELVSDLESKKLEFLVAGIGLNLNVSLADYPEDLKNKVGILKLDKVNRNQLIAMIAQEVIEIFQDFDKEGILEEYKKSQLLFGKMVEFEQGGQMKIAKAVDISPEGELVVLADGKEIHLNSGEVSVRLGQSSGSVL